MHESVAAARRHHFVIFSSCYEPFLDTFKAPCRLAFKTWSRVRASDIIGAYVADVGSAQLRLLARWLWCNSLIHGDQRCRPR